MSLSKDMEKPLVTVGVVTYNAEKFIEDTLDSVYNQTYRNIELILSDDHSSDNTVEVAKKWFDKHKDRFVRTLLITSDVNTGVSANGNRAIFQAKGEWYKSLDGDDMLTTTSIEDYVEFVNSKSDVSFVFGRIAVFRGDFDVNKLEVHKPAFYDYLYREEVTAKTQFHVLTKHFAASGSSGFYKLSVLRDEMGGYDERFPLMEDHPILIKFTKHGYKLWLLDKVTLYYRISSNSITNSMSQRKQILSNHDIRQVIDYKFEYLNENYGWYWKLLLKYTNYLKRKIYYSGNSNAKFICRFYNNILRLTNPYPWHGRLLTLYYLICK